MSFMNNEVSLSRKSQPFSIITNEVAQGLIYEPEALALYTYIHSLPPDWVFYKSHLQKVANMGINKLNRLLKVLENHGLIIQKQYRDAQGKYAHFHLDVLDCASFKPIKNNKITAKKPYAKNRATETVHTENNTYIINNNKTNKDKINISCATDVARESEFDEFWKLYPKKKDRLRAKERFNKLDQDVIPIMMQRLKQQIERDAQWKDKRYIPSPEKYLSNEKWNDEIIEVCSNKIQNESKPYQEKPKVNEPRSTVLEWGPGHPDWEARHGRKGSIATTGNTRRNDMHQAKEYLF